MITLELSNEDRAAIAKKLFSGLDLLEIAKTFKLSSRDELEITCINRT